MTPQIFRQKICAFLCLFLLPTLVCACAANGQETAEHDANSLIIYSPRPLSITDNVLARFEQETGIDAVCISLRTSDALIRIEGEQGMPQADVLWPASLETVRHKEALFDSVSTYGYAPTALMVNTDTIGTAVINGYRDLLKPEYRGRIAFADPAMSSASYAHLVNMLYAMGSGDPDKGWEYVAQFVKQLNGTLLSSDEEVFQGVIHGYYSVGLTLAESSEEYVHAGAHVKSVYMLEGVMFHEDGVCLIKDAPHKDNAAVFEQWLLGERTQVYLQKSQYHTSLYSLRDLAHYNMMYTSSGIRMISGNEEEAAKMHSEWLMRFDALMKEQ